MKVLVTGAAGFIGSFVCKRLLERGDEVVGVDNINDYYSPELKFGRLALLGIRQSEVEWHNYTQSSTFERFRFTRIDIEEREAMQQLFEQESFESVINLAAQAGVRYSIENPYAYTQSNICGFLNILEGCRNKRVKHLIYASSSSIYGLNANVPFAEGDSTAHPVSLYAATKKANELMAHSYSHLYNIPTTGVRFFTVYGPWGRPDMSPFLFADAILNDRPIRVFNNGDMLRDFTYIDDIVEGVVRIVDSVAQPNEKWDAKNPDPSSSSAPYRIYNIGNSHPVRLMDFIEAFEEALNRKAKKEFLPMQPGDVYQTNADTTLLEQAIGFSPATPLNYGVHKTVEWYREFYKI
ncbi:MAG: NAD-dependent epimerase [Rikenellaceae bacterium]